MRSMLERTGCSPRKLSATLTNPREGERETRPGEQTTLFPKSSDILPTRNTEAKKGQHNGHNKTTLHNTQTKKSRNPSAASPHKHKSERTWEEQYFGDDQDVQAGDGGNARSCWQPWAEREGAGPTPRGPLPLPRQHLGLLPMAYETRGGEGQPPPAPQP